MAADPLNLADETARINYSLGYQIGGDFKRQGVEMNTAAIVKGIEDAISGAEPLMQPEDMRTTLMELKRKIVAEQKAKAAEQEQKMVEAGKKFMEENAKQPGVVTTASGLQYQIVEAGKGKTPSPTDQVTRELPGHPGRRQGVRQLLFARAARLLPVERRRQGLDRGAATHQGGWQDQALRPADARLRQRGPAGAPDADLRRGADLRGRAREVSRRRASQTQCGTSRPDGEVVAPPSAGGPRHLVLLEPAGGNCRSGRRHPPSRTISWRRRAAASTSRALPDGRPMRAVRPEGFVLEGEQAACVTCHRDSGMGSVEGSIDRTILVPPVAGPLLFAPARFHGLLSRSLPPLGAQPGLGTGAHPGRL